VSWVNRDGISGYNVNPQNPEALAGAIREILSDTKRYEDLSIGARQRYQTMFTQDKMVDKCLKIYEDFFDKPLSLPVGSFFDEVKTLLDKGNQVRIPVKGRSMRPFLKDGDTVILASKNDRSVRWGDIVLACTTTNRIVLHRVVYRKKDTIWLMGDAHSRQKEQTMKIDVLAVAISAHRKGKELKINSFLWRCTVMIWFIVLPLRGILVRIYDLFNR
jgi:ribosomal protein L24